MSSKPPHLSPSPVLSRHSLCSLRPAVRLSLSLLVALLLVFAQLIPLSSCLSTHSPRANLPSSSDAPPPSAVARYSFPSVPTPAGLLFVSTLDGQLHAVDVLTGNYLWAFGTGESLLRSQPATSVVGVADTRSAADVGDWDVMRGVEDEEDRLEQQYQQQNGASADDSPPSDVDHLIIPGLNGQLFFSTRSGQLQRLPVTVNELVAASPFKSADDRMYVGRKSSAFILLDRRTGKVKRVLNEYGERVYHTTSDGDGESEEELVDDSELIWIGRQDLSVHAYHPTQGKRWNVSLSEYFSHLDGAAAARVWSEEELQSIGLPHLAATVDGELYAIKDVHNRDMYQWRQAFSSPISSVHFSRDPSSLAAAASLTAPSQLDILLPSSQLVKLPVYYLQPSAQRGDGMSQMSLVDQYLYVRMKAVKTKTVDTYVGQTKEGVLYALPNPPSKEGELNILPPEQDFLLGYQPPVESDKAIVPAAAAGGSTATCPVGHPYWPHCMIGLHSITDSSMLSTTGVYVGLPGLPPIPTPAVLNVSVPPPRDSDYSFYFSRDDNSGAAGGATDVWLKLLVSINMLLVAAVVAYIAYDKMNSGKKKKKKKEKSPQAVEMHVSESAATILAAVIATEATQTTPLPDIIPLSPNGTGKEADEEKKELHESPAATPPSSGHLIVPTNTSLSSVLPRQLSNSSSTSSRLPLVLLSHQLRRLSGHTVHFPRLRVLFSLQDVQHRQDTDLC